MRNSHNGCQRNLQQTAVPISQQTINFNALRAFEATARHLSFSKAGDELHVTHSAVSHHIKQLEQQIGTQLFHRSNRGVRLTKAGEALAPVVSRAFRRLLDGINEAASGADSPRLNLTTTPVFASRWLLPRLADWRSRERAREIEVNVFPTVELVDFLTEGIDAGIRCGKPPWPGLAADFLMPVTLTPVCSRSWIEDCGFSGDPGELLEADLIHADIKGHVRGEEWAMWFAAAGVPLRGDLVGRSYQDPGLAWQAAQEGQGVALGYLELVAADLQAGNLVAPLPVTARHEFSYYLVYDPDRRPDKAVALFRDWLLQEAA